MGKYDKPEIGNVVHYVSYGTPKGEFRPRCRAAFVTEVGQWVTMETTPRPSYDKSEGRAIRTVEQWFYGDATALAVVNPTGMFFNGAAEVACRHDEESRASGTWHWGSRDCLP